MHPDQAVQLAIQDLRPRGRPTASPAPAPARWVSLLRAFLHRLRWHVHVGRTPVADAGAAAGRLPRPRLGFGAAHSAPAAESVDAALAPLGRRGGR